MRYTFAFCLASARQLAQPMPELPPVTMTVFPAMQHYYQVWPGATVTIICGVCPHLCDAWLLYSHDGPVEIQEAPSCH